MADITRNPTAISDISRDVNELPLPVKHPISYLGVSMPPAVLRVIRSLYPECKDVFAELQAEDAQLKQPSFVAHPPSLPLVSDSLDMNDSSAWNGIPLINAYFTYFHPSLPFIDERYFRATYMSQQRKDVRWNLLLNMMLALGSIAANTAEDLSHQVYYDRAKQYLGPETFSSAHWETIQALGLLGGLYLHHIQQPDEGIAIVGGALRLALALGLHRDSATRLTSRDAGNSNTGAPVHNPSLAPEMRSRIWWALFIMDTLGCTGLGRPSMGRVSPAVSTKIPTEPIGNSLAMTKLFQDTVQYCMISTRIEDAMALSPLIEDAKCNELDQALTDWFQSFSAQDMAMPGLGRLIAHRHVLRWRYYLSRIILNRPMLLWYAMRGLKPRALRPEQKTAIETCRKAADELITDIATTWRTQKACQFFGIHATWILYQAVMVLLLSLFSDYLDSNIVAACRQQVEVAKSALLDLHSWSPIGQQSFESVNLIYAASQRFSAQKCSRGSRGHLRTSLIQQSAPAVELCVHDENIDDQAQLNRDGHTALDTPAHDDFIDSNGLISVNWSTSWDNIDYMLDMQDLDWRPMSIPPDTEGDRVILSAHGSPPASGLWQI